MSSYRIDNQHGDELGAGYSTFEEAREAAIQIWTAVSPRPFGRGSAYVVGPIGVPYEEEAVEVCGMGRVLDV